MARELFVYTVKLFAYTGGSVLILGITGGIIYAIINLYYKDRTTGAEFKRGIAVIMAILIIAWAVMGVLSVITGIAMLMA